MPGSARNASDERGRLVATLRSALLSRMTYGGTAAARASAARHREGAVLQRGQSLSRAGRTAGAIRLGLDDGRGVVEHPRDLVEIGALRPGGDAVAPRPFLGPREVKVALRPTQRDVQQSSFLVDRVGGAARGGDWDGGPCR